MKAIKRVLKFGGSSVADAERIQRVIELVKIAQQQRGPIAVVFSAFGGVTDMLIKIANTSALHEEKYLGELAELEDRHMQVLETLALTTEQNPLKPLFKELREMLQGVFWVKELAPRSLDFILSFGERLSCQIITRALNDRGIKVRMLDARDVVKTDNSFGNALVLFDKTEELIKNHFAKAKKLQIITGFIGSTLDNKTTTLGRGGSDYTAAILGAALNVDEIEIWTDVDGVMTANPRQVTEAFPLEQISYEEAMELSHFGAKVIYPPTMQPAMVKKIPIRIKNTLNPDFPGTLICERSIDSRFMVKGISSISDISLLCIQGSGMVGITGVAGRLFTILAQHCINIILITQASSEHSICIAIDPKSVETAKRIIEKEFELEMQINRIDPVVIRNNLSILAAVGENMHDNIGLSGRLFTALGEKRVNVVAIAQGSSELNISIVINQADERKALNAIHETFFLDKVMIIRLQKEKR